MIDAKNNNTMILPPFFGTCTPQVVKAVLACYGGILPCYFSGVQLFARSARMSTKNMMKRSRPRSPPGNQRKKKALRALQGKGLDAEGLVSGVDECGVYLMLYQVIVSFTQYFSPYRRDSHATTKMEYVVRSRRHLVKASSNRRSSIASFFFSRWVLVRAHIFRKTLPRSMYVFPDCLRCST